MGTLSATELGKYLPLKKSHLPALYKDLELSIASLEKSKDKKLLAKILKVYVAHHQFDKTYYPYEMLAPFYSKNKELVIKELSKFKKADRDLAKRNLDVALNEIINGNG
ncbi:MAG: hypothetical protein ACJAT2_000394 [Bacteriovoracaceae bacterium]|jgi:hypothetical protein